ncbi:amidotransferase [Pseudomonas fulva]|uniref:amidotransferase n=1 Tax=Pseudomonas fulva TaxID=47880 RepID=UPI000EEDB2FB|nr:amidotransferase [Pseudomonas fulva]HCP29795.1 amidotransferase [Pseudomonas sp.]MBA1209315.1 amidotransferase [Pseudomonas fulva]MBA1218797.1 amidotransferase [Pseudomonas fulva]MDH0574165.1 amidotransferase [Pseudomonas fulva]RRW63633.1 amidotransferase [Pseudomonas fulva]
MSLRICILETDVLRPELTAQYEGYGRMFEQLFARQPITAQFSVYNVMNGEYPAEDLTFDAYLVTGSKADSFGSDPWIQTLKAYLLKLYDQGEKLLGVCFGHQLLALTLGGKAERAEQGWGVGVHRYSLSALAPWMQPQVSELTLLISHQDQVTELPKGATVIASSDFCPNAAYCIGDQVLCFQGHPEFVHDYSRALLDARQAHLGDEVYHKAVASLATEHQGDVVGEWMLRFIQQPASKHNAA